MIVITVAVSHRIGKAVVLSLEKVQRKVTDVTEGL